MTVNPSPSLPTSPSPQLAAVLKWIDAVTSANFVELGDAITDDYIHALLPASLGAPLTHGRDATIQVYKDILSALKVFSITIHEVTEVPGKVVIHASGDAKTGSGFHYLNEYMFTFNLTQQADGSFKVAKTQEFTDSKATAEFLQVLAKDAAAAA